jgi:hypothetical protein
LDFLLQGSERQKKSHVMGRQLSELKEINKSLLCLQVNSMLLASK